MYENFFKVYDIISAEDPEIQIAFVCTILDCVASANKMTTTELINYIRPLIVDVNDFLGPVINY